MGQIEILGTSGVATTWGLHYYLKTYCNVHISWEGNQVELPDTLPDVRVKISSNDRYQYNLKLKMQEISSKSTNWTGLDIIRMCVLWVILLHGGSGKIGKKISIGWLLMESIWRLLLLDKKLSGRKSIFD